jgi:hypothetical protein
MAHVSFEITKLMMDASLDVVKTVRRMISVLQQSWQAGAVTQGGFILGGALWAPSLDFWGENPRSDIYWLYLAMTDLYAPLDEGIV